MIAERLKRIRPSGVRRIFDMASRMKDPIDLSLGEPDFDVPEDIKRAGIHWIEQGFNKYTLTQGIPELRQRGSGRPSHLGRSSSSSTALPIPAGPYILTRNWKWWLALPGSGG
jgi:hypothetical protein